MERSSVRACSGGRTVVLQEMLPRSSLQCSPSIQPDPGWIPLQLGRWQCMTAMQRAPGQHAPRGAQMHHRPCQPAAGHHGGEHLREPPASYLGHNKLSQSLFPQQRERRASWEGKRASAWCQAGGGLRGPSIKHRPAGWGDGVGVWSGCPCGAGCLRALGVPWWDRVVGSACCGAGDGWCSACFPPTAPPLTHPRGLWEWVVALTWWPPAIPAEGQQAAGKPRRAWGEGAAGPRGSIK